MSVVWRGVYDPRVRPNEAPDGPNRPLAEGVDILIIMVVPANYPFTPMNNRPRVITEAEWQEIASLAAVREAWSLDEDTDPLAFASQVYGAKFDFISGGPGYVGDLYLLQGDALDEVPPMVLRRDRDGHLTL